MELFLDSVDIFEIKKYQDYGIIDGVTTNPSLMAKSSMGFEETASNICKIVHGDVSIEVASNDYNSMLIEGKKILEIAENVVIKLPITMDGIKACSYFAERGKKTNMTLCFSSSQAILAAKAGAAYVSPFIGRLEDVGADGIQLIEDIREIYDNFAYETKILAASIRNKNHLEEAAIVGADVATLPAKIIEELVQHKLTDAGLKQFNQDWNNSGKQI